MLWTLPPATRIVAVRIKQREIEMERKMNFMLWNELWVVQVEQFLRGMVLGPTHGINAVKWVMSCASAYSQKLKEKPKNPLHRTRPPLPFCFFPFYSSLISPPQSPTLLLTHYLSNPPLFSHFLSFLPTAATPLSLSLTLLSLSHSLHQFTSFPPSSLLSLCFFFLWIPVSHHAVILTALFITMTSS